MLLAAKSTHDGFPVPHKSHSSCLAANVKSFEQPYHRGPVWSGKKHVSHEIWGTTWLFALCASKIRGQGRRKGRGILDHSLGLAFKECETRNPQFYLKSFNVTLDWQRYASTQKPWGVGRKRNLREEGKYKGMWNLLSSWVASLVWVPTRWDNEERCDDAGQK